MNANFLLGAFAFGLLIHWLTAPVPTGAVSHFDGITTTERVVF